MTTDFTTDLPLLNRFDSILVHSCWSILERNKVHPLQQNSHCTQHSLTLPIQCMEELWTSLQHRVSDKDHSLPHKSWKTSANNWVFSQNSLLHSIHKQMDRINKLRSPIIPLAIYSWETKWMDWLATIGTVLLQHKETSLYSEVILWGDQVLYTQNGFQTKSN